MNLKSMALAAGLSIAAALPSQANHYLQTADQSVVNALNELIYFYGGYCQNGVPMGCNLMQFVQVHGGALLNAGYECQGGNQQACSFYNQKLGEFQTFYYQAVQSAQQYNVGNAQNYSQQAHMQRMQEIHDTGTANTAAFNQRMQAMDDNHQQFLEMIRQ